MYIFRYLSCTKLSSQLHFRFGKIKSSSRCICLYAHIQTINLILFDEWWRQYCSDNNVRVFGGFYEGGPCLCSWIFWHCKDTSVSRFKMMVRHCEDSFEFLTACDKWLHHALQEFCGCLFVLLAFQQSLSTAAFHFYLLKCFFVSPPPRFSILISFSVSFWSGCVSGLVFPEYFWRFVEHLNWQGQEEHSIWWSLAVFFISSEPRELLLLQTSGQVIDNVIQFSHNVFGVHSIPHSNMIHNLFIHSSSDFYLTAAHLTNRVSLSQCVSDGFAHNFLSHFHLHVCFSCYLLNFCVSKITTVQQLATSLI